MFQNMESRENMVSIHTDQYGDLLGLLVAIAVTVTRVRGKNSEFF